MDIATIEFTPQKHSETGGSGLWRWRADHCPGSVNLIRDKAPAELDIADEVRDDGIEAHGFAARLLTATDGDNHPAALKATFLNHGGSDAMFWAVVKYVDYVKVFATQEKAELLVEHGFDLNWLWRNLYGTADAIVYCPESDFLDMSTGEVCKGPILHVIDLKYGFIGVDAVENDQALYYALGAYKTLRDQGKEVKRIVIHIYQPRAFGKHSVPKVWVCDEAYLEKFALRLKKDAEETENINAALRVGDWCRLCKGRTVCHELAKPAFLALRAQLKIEGVKDEDLPTMEQFNKDRALQVKAARMAKIWADAILERTRVEMIRGETYEGLKLVAPNMSRVFRNTPVILEKFPVAMFPEMYEKPDLKSPAQVLIGLKANPFASVEQFEKDYIQKVEKREPLIADIDDPRPALDPAKKVKDEWADETIKRAPVADTPPAYTPPPQQTTFLAPPAPINMGGMADASFLAKPN